MAVTLPERLRDGLVDAARRLADRHNELLGQLTHEEILAGVWIACRLSDGECLPEVFTRRRDAVRHVPDARWYAFVRIQITGMGANEAVTFVAYNRLLADQGVHQMPDPDTEVIMPSMSEDLATQNGSRLKLHTLATRRLSVEEMCLIAGIENPPPEFLAAVRKRLPQ